MEETPNFVTLPSYADGIRDFAGGPSGDGAYWFRLCPSLQEDDASTPTLQK